MPVVDSTSHWLPDAGEQPQLRQITVAELLEEAAAKWPEREAIVYSAYDDLGIAVRWTFRELRERARDVGRAMVASGFQRGERVGIWATNRPEWLLVQFGAAYAGVVFVPMNPLYRTSEVAYVLGKAGASACFLEPENRGVSLWAILAEVAGDLPSLHSRVALTDASGLDGPGLEEWLEVGRGISDAQLDARRADIEPNDTSQIQFTSGTTGFPKGAELRNAATVNNARLFAHRALFHEGGRHCNPMPFFHCGGCVMATLGAVATGSVPMRCAGMMRPSCSATSSSRAP